MSAGHVGGTHGSGIVSSAADLLWMNVVRGMRGVGGVCEMCMRPDWGGVGGEGGEWMRRLGLCLPNPAGTGGVGRVSVFWLRWCLVWAGGLEGRGGAMSGPSVQMAGPCICVVCLAYACAPEVHPVSNPDAPHGYLPPNMHLSIADITNPDSFV